MRIRAVAVIPIALEAPDVTSADQNQDAAILRIETDEGLTGIAEINHTPAAVRAFAEAPATSNQTRGLADVLVGRDAQDAGLREELLAGNRSSARRGLGLAVLNAVDVALWDLRAQGAGVPLWRLLWGDAAQPPACYVTLYTGAGTYAETLARLAELVRRAADVDCRAYKVEPLAECVPDGLVSDFTAAARDLVGERAPMLVDVYERYATAEQAAEAIDRLRPFRPELIETPLPVDDVAEYARLAELTDVPLGAAELYESVAEFEALLAGGGVACVQPWPNRVGVSGTLDVIERARRHGRKVLLGGWNATPIGDAVGIHLASGLGPGIALEHAPAAVYDGSSLRRVAGPATAPVEGRLPLPQAPGLGVALDEELLDYHARLAGVGEALPARCAARSASRA